MIGSLIGQLKKKFQSLTPLDSDTIFWTKGDDGITPHLRDITEAKISKPQASSPAAEASTPWSLELSGSDIISKNAVAYWYSELVLLATEASPLTWTAPALSSSLYVDVYYDTSWHCVATTTAGSTAGHQYILVGKYEYDGSITQYQHGILRIGDRYQ